MSLFVDARVPVLFADADTVASPDTAWLIEGDAPSIGDVVERFQLTAGHAPGCACCLPRSAAAEAFNRLFLRRAKGEVGFFTRVVVDATAPGRAAVVAALAGDPFVSGRVRAPG
jgi:hypothetical protein